jgi:hypothetical protein
MKSFRPKMKVSAMKLRAYKAPNLVKAKIKPIKIKSHKLRP